VFGFDGRPDNQTIPGDVCAEAPQGEGSSILIKRAGSDLDGKHRFHLDERQTGHNRPRSRLADDAFDVFGTSFLVVKLCQCAGVEEATGQSAFFPGCDHCVRKRPRN
jgi:hypothetical protein